MHRALLLASMLLPCCAFGACSSSATDPATAPPSVVTSPDAAHPTDEAGAAQPTDDAGAAQPDAEPLDAGPDQSPDTPSRLGVLSQNLHCLKTDGTVFTTNDARFAAIAAAVSAEDIDVILAQEICVSATEDARTMLVAALSKATGTTWSSASAFAHRAWVGTPDEADEYVAIFSRGALSDPKDAAHYAQGSLRRVALSATMASRLKSPSGADLPVRVQTVHLDHEDPAVRAPQGREVASVAMVWTDDAHVAIDSGNGAVALPLIVGGDFNSTNDAEPPQALVEFGFVETSGSAGTTRIDHVFAHRSAPFAASSSKELFEGAAAVSDHPGVLVQFVPAAPKPERLTRVLAPGAFPTPIALRGDQAPLSWQRGWPAFPRVSGSSPGVAVVTGELPAAAFTYKFLRQDTDWATGANVSGMGETDNTSTPSFP